MNKQTINKFWSKVDIRSVDECWEWQAGIMSTGYGNFSVTVGQQISSHRMSWIITNGDIPKGLWVLHKCDNRKCVNPNHLFLGTYRDNIDDMVSKKRNLRREKQVHSKLKESEVSEIKRLLDDSNLTITDISKMFKVSRQNVSYIKHGLIWKGNS